MSIGTRIKNRRKELGLSADEVAEKLGKNRATIYRYESDYIQTLPTDVLIPLAKVLETTPADLMGFTNPGDKTEEEETYYTNKETAKIAQKIYEDPDLRVLFDAAQDVKPEAIQQAANMLKLFKNTNRE